MSNVTVCELSVPSGQQTVAILTVVCVALTVLAQMFKCLLPQNLQSILDLFRPADRQKAPLTQVLRMVDDVHKTVTPANSRSVSNA